MGEATSSERDRPLGRSGCVTTPTTSNPSPSNARSGGAANSGVPQKRTLMAPSERLLSVPSGDLVRRQLPNVLRKILLHRLPLRDRGASLEKAEVVEEQLAVQMIDLVLQAAREQVRRVELEGLAVAVQRANGDARGAVDVAEDLGDRETPLFSAGGAFGVDDLGVHDHDRVVLDVDDGEALRSPDLRRGKPDSLGGVHRLEHVIGEATELVGHAVDGRRLLAEDRGAVNVNVEERQETRTAAGSWWLGLVAG